MIWSLTWIRPSTAAALPRLMLFTKIPAISSVQQAHTTNMPVTPLTNLAPHILNRHSFELLSQRLKLQRTMKAKKFTIWMHSSASGSTTITVLVLSCSNMTESTKVFMSIFKVQVNLSFTSHNILMFSWSHNYKLSSPHLPGFVHLSPAPAVC